MSEEGEVAKERKQDPDGTRLLCKVLDKIDLTLTLNGMGFKAEKSWEDFGAQILALLYEHYDDVTGGDSSYAPGDSNSGLSDVSESETLGSQTDTLSEGDADDEESDGEEEDTRPSKKTKTV